MTDIVLVPGSWLGAWAWRDVTARLRSQGHNVHELTLTGMGDREHLGGPETTFETHVSDVIAHLDTEELDDIVLVGHSYAGAVVTAVGARVPDRVGRLVYLAGLVPGSGAPMIEQMPPAAAEGMKSFVEDGWRIPVAPDFILDEFYGDHGIAGDVATWFRAHATHHPLGTYTSPVDYDVDAWNTLDRVYVKCANDPGEPMVAPGTPGWQHEVLPTGHWPMFTLPTETAALLDSLTTSAKRKAKDL